jgi:hypothetical protein
VVIDAVNAASPVTIGIFAWIASPAASEAERSAEPQIQARHLRSTQTPHRRAAPHRAPPQTLFYR